MYNEQDLLEVLRRRPFVPLALQIATGETFAISHPEQVLVTSTDGVRQFRNSVIPKVFHFGVGV